jgi:hypothetical protein
MSVTFRKEGGDNQVNVDMSKMARRNGNGSGQGMSVGMHLCILIRDILAGPLVDILSHAVPKETGGNESLASSNARMAKEWTCSKICQRQERGMRGRNVEMEMSTRMEPVRERGMEVMKRERLVFRSGRDGQAWDCCGHWGKREQRKSEGEVGEAIGYNFVAARDLGECGRKFRKEGKMLLLSG